MIVAAIFDRASANEVVDRTENGETLLVIEKALLVVERKKEAATRTSSD